MVGTQGGSGWGTGGGTGEGTGTGDGDGTGDGEGTGEGAGVGQAAPVPHGGGTHMALGGQQRIGPELAPVPLWGMATQHVGEVHGGGHVVAGRQQRMAIALAEPDVPSSGTGPPQHGVGDVDPEPAQHVVAAGQHTAEVPEGQQAAADVAAQHTVAVGAPVAATGHRQPVEEVSGQGVGGTGHVEEAHGDGQPVDGHAGPPGTGGTAPPPVEALGGPLAPALTDPPPAAEPPPVPWPAATGAVEPVDHSPCAEAP